MSLILRLLTLGIVPALWLSGYAILGRLSAGARLPISRSVAFCLAPALSLPAWSLAMTLSAYFGAFNAPTWGAIGWISCLPLAPLVAKRGWIGRRPALVQSLALGLVLAVGFVMYAAFPHDSYFVGRDQAAYANQALHIARSGELKLRIPVQIEDEQFRRAVSNGYAATGMYANDGVLTVQFAPVLPIWLAMAFSALGIVGLQGFNAAVAVLAACVFFGVASRLMSRPVAIVATAMFALNPMQIWISRITLSEILAQYLMLAGLLLPLIARRRRPELPWLLGGLTLGASVYVRIDGFVLAPLVLASAWVVRALRPGGVSAIDRAERLGVLGVLFALAVGVPLYLLTSAPYMAAQAKNLIPLAAAAALIAIPWATRFGARQLAFVSNRRAFWLGLGLVLLVVGLFAYFIRPRWEPFHHHRAGNGEAFSERDYRENSLLNLGVYITPVLVFLGLGGFWHLLRGALSARPKGALALLLVVCGGYSLLYLYDPAISPDHPWGMRRFVPVIIPGFILFGFFLIDQLRAIPVLRRLRRLRVPASALLGALLIAQVGYRSRTGLFVREYAGAYAFVSKVADAIPTGALLLCDVSPRLFGHLALGRQLNAIKASFRMPERFAAAQAVVTAALDEDEPYYVLADSVSKLPGEKPIRTFKAKFRWLAEATRAPASELHEARFTFFLFERRGPLEEPWRYLTDLGMAPSEDVREGGFWPVEVIDGERTRWTQKTAWLDISLNKTWIPRTFNLDIVGLPPTGSWFTVRANDKEIYNAKLEVAPVNLSLRLPKKISRRLKLELISDTFRPSEVGDSADQRELGVRIKAMSLR